MQAIFEEKEVWYIVDNSKLELIIAGQIRRKNKDNAITTKIIKQKLNSDFYINIINK